METQVPNNSGTANYDRSLIRPAMRHEEINLRGRNLPKQKINTIKKALRTLHTLEIMAVNIYKFQITRQDNELNRSLIAAMCNEMTHVQDFQVKLYEYGLKPGIFRWAYWIVGFVFGFFSKMIGEKAILKTGIWVETKAVSHYSELLAKVDWDEDTRKIIEKDQSDEYGHIEQWQKLLRI